MKIIKKSKSDKYLMIDTLTGILTRVDKDSSTAKNVLCELRNYFDLYHFSEIKETLKELMSECDEFTHYVFLFDLTESTYWIAEL